MLAYYKIGSYLVTLYAFYRLRTYVPLLWKRLSGNGTDVDIHKVFFFPETKISLRDRHREYDQLISTYPDSPLVTMLSVLKTCLQSLDICLFGISFETMFRLIEDLSRKGVSVRIVIHRETKNSIFSEESALSRDTIDRLKETLKYGTQLKIIGLSDDRLLHHKFAIIDGKILINGSFNWSENSIFHSFNDGVITSDPKLVLSFQREFNKIWFNHSF